jgi:hypothetical protein
VLRIHDSVLGPDDRVDVLEEDDPGRDLVRPTDALRLLLVLAEVPRSVDELLRPDRRPQPRVRERDALTRLVGTAALELLPHRRHVEDRDLVAVDHADPRVVPERDQLHSTTPQIFIAARP